MRELRLAVALIKHRARLGLLITALSMVALVLCSVSLMTLTSARAAIKQGIESDFGNRKFAVQVLSDSGLSDALAARSDLTPVQDVPGATISTDSGTAPVTARKYPLLEHPLGLGVLREGRWPENSREVAVSRYVFRALDLQLSQRVTIQVGPDLSNVQVVGVSTQPADARESTVQIVSAVSAQEATEWLTNTDPFADHTISPSLDNRTAKGRTVALLADEQAVIQARSLFGTLASASTAVLLAGIAALGAALFSAARPLSLVVANLADAGMASRRGWYVVAIAGSLVILLGAMCGELLSWVALNLSKEWVSSQFNQDWNSVTAPWFRLIIYALVAVVGSLLVASIAYFSTILLTKVSTPKESRIQGPGVIAAFLILITLSIAAAYTGSMAISVILGLSAVIAFFWVVKSASLLRLRRSKPTLARLQNRLSAAFLPLSCVFGCVTLLSAFATANSVHDGNYTNDASQAPQPTGSYLVYEVPSRSATLIATSYKNLGGRQIREFILPDESKGNSRVAWPGMVGCLEASPSKDPNNLPESCYPDDGASSLNIVAMTREPGDQVVADPYLIEDGKTGFMKFLSTSPEAESSGYLSAVPDRQLGGNMPGAVVSVGSETAERLALDPSDGRLLAMLDFHSLTSQNQARMRSLIPRFAGAAQVSEDQGGAGDPAKALGVLSGAVGAFIMLFALSISGAAVVSSLGRLLRLLGEMGINSDLRRGLALRLSLLPAGTSLLGCALGRLAAEGGGQLDNSGYGLYWALPGAGALLACVVLSRTVTNVWRPASI